MVDHRPVAFVEIGDALGEAGERERIGAEISLALAIADRQRSAHPGSDQHSGMVAEQDGDGKGAVEAGQDGRDRFLRAFALLELVVDQMGDDLAVGLRLEGAPCGLHLLAKQPEILDDAVVDQRHSADDVGMGVADRWSAVGRPARMGDPDRSGERTGGELGGEIVELAFGAAALEPAVQDRADPRRIIAAIFEPPQTLHEPVGHFLSPDDADDAAHVFLLTSRHAGAGWHPSENSPWGPSLRWGDVLDQPAFFFASIAARKRAAQPGFASWTPRARASESASTSRVTTDPAPTIAPAPMLTGATSAELEPMKAPSPIVVPYLK
jgi:hypothetical protein